MTPWDFGAIRAALTARDWILEGSASPNGLSVSLPQELNLGSAASST